MKNPFEKKAKAEQIRKMYFTAITPPEGPTWWGVLPSLSEDGVRQKVMELTGRTRQEIAGRVSVTLLRPPAGMIHREKFFTVVHRKTKEDFLNELLGKAL